MVFLGVYLVLAGLVSGGWYWFSTWLVRRKALLIMRWIEASLAGQGQVVGMRWLSPLRFKVSLRLVSCMFLRSWMLVELRRCQTPLHWLWAYWTNQQDLVIFQADLDWAPTFSLEVQNFRWFARSSRKSPSGSKGWTFEQTGPFVMTTRMDWQKDVASAMTSLVGLSNREFLHIKFSRRSPHFSVTLPLDAISPGYPGRACVFDAVRQVAASSLPSLF